MSYIKKSIAKKIKNFFVLIIILILFNLAAFLLSSNTPNKYQARILFEPSKLNTEYLQSPEEILAYLKTPNTHTELNRFKFTKINYFIMAEVQSKSADIANSDIKKLLDILENQAINTYNARKNAKREEDRMFREFIKITEKVLFSLDNNERKKMLHFLASVRFYYIFPERTKTKVILNQEATIKPLYKQPALIYMLFNIFGFGFFYYLKKIISSRLAYLHKEYN